MNLRELVQDPTVPDLDVTGLCLDSRRVRPGDVFLAYAGTQADGHQFAEEAARSGAVAVISERTLSLPCPSIAIPELKSRVSSIAGRFFEEPSEGLDIAGVTGTNGKTSIAYLLAHVMPDAGFLGTIGWGAVSGLLKPAELTTVDAVNVQARLRALADADCSFVAMEVSSHALDQHRVDGVFFDVGIFSNLTRDHLDYHGTMAAYRDAKRHLFDLGVSTAIINIDDPTGRDFAAALPMDVVTVGEGGDVSWHDVAFVPTGIRARCITPWGNAAVELPMFGAFTLSNVGAVIAAAVSMGASLSRTIERLQEGVGVPGRMQFVSNNADGEAGGKTVVVDYAHTPDGIRAALEAVRSHCRGAITIVFGCGGDRDRGKRSEMAAVAERLAERVVITSDNPRTEDVDRILDDVEAGFSAAYRKHVRRISDRYAAIRLALDETGAGDIVLVAGKGHEKYQEIDGERLPFDDVEVAREYLALEQ